VETRTVELWNNHSGMTIQRLSRAGLVVAVTAAAILCLPTTPAWAHARLLATSPANGAQVTGPVTEVTLTFNEMVRQRSTTVAVVGADGTSYGDGAARVVDHNVIQAVRALPAGTYRVAWQTVSADGDPEGDQFGFTIVGPPSPAAQAQPPAGTSQPAPAVPTTPPAAAQPVPAGDSGNLTWLWVPLAAVVLVALLAAGLLWRRRTSAGGP
jgi:methionine-rich copper-binding protein CopC